MRSELRLFRNFTPSKPRITRGLGSLSLSWREFFARPVCKPCKPDWTLGDCSEGFGLSFLKWISAIPAVVALAEVQGRLFRVELAKNAGNAELPKSFEGIKQSSSANWFLSWYLPCCWKQEATPLLLGHSSNFGTEVSKRLRAEPHLRAWPKAWWSYPWLPEDVCSSGAFLRKLWSKKSASGEE